MFKKIFRKVFLLAGIFLLATFMLVQLSWGCDDEDKWDRDCHDKWHCDHHGKPCHPPKIQRVYLDYQADSIVFEIWGKNFDNGVTPVVTLGGTIELRVGPYSENQIEATLPLKHLPEEFAYGDYKLVVSTCRGSKCKDKHCKDKYCKDHEYKCKCKDKYCLTIAAAGPAVGLEIVTQIVSKTISEEEFRANSELTPDVKVPCPSGYAVTGGGFSQKLIEIKESKPLKDENAWHVIGQFIVGKGEAYAITVHAVCVKVQ